MITIEGEVEEIIFRNDINGYTVCSIKHDEDMVTIIGHMVSVGIGETIKATGKWVKHPNYGDQFKAEYCERQLPRTQASITKFLGSGVIKGIREATAKKIIDRFSDEALNIIKFEPHRLAEIKGISMEKALGIGQAFHEYGDMWDLSVFLQQYGISPLFVSRIHKQFGDRAIEIIKGNPYRLADEVPGIGFKTADRIALSLGIDPTLENRVASCITYILVKAALEQGHTFLPKEKIEEYASQLLGIESELISDVIISLAVSGKIIIDKGIESQNVFLKLLSQAEAYVAGKLISLSLTKFDDIPDDIGSCVQDIENQQNMVLVEDQKKAVEEALQNGVTVITGGPGTGKTTIVNTIVGLLERIGLTYVLAAPTGRAAKRLSEATGREARTIHRLLELGRREDEAVDMLNINRNAPAICEDVVIIDEASMVDIILINHLLKSVTEGTRLIIVGDVDQLPAVGPGNVLKDIISSGVIKVVRLTEIFRQARESMIVVNAHRINKGGYPVFNTAQGDFFLSRNSSGEDILKNIISLCAERLPKHKGYDPMIDIQVLSPTRKGLIGVGNLNNQLQKVLNPQANRKRHKKLGEISFIEGDKVMQVKNNYDLVWKRLTNTGEMGFGVFNGDIGRITDIDEDAGVLRVTYDDKEVEYGVDLLDELELAYAVTVHKSQGSEFPVVIMPVFGGLPMLTTRNLLYTAITRAKEMVVLVGREDDVRAMVDNYREVKRYSGLLDKLTSVDVMPYCIKF